LRRRSKSAEYIPCVELAPISLYRNHILQMAVSSIQDRTNEFRSVLTQVQKRQATSKVGAQRQSLLTDSQKAAANGSATGDGKPRRSEFARRAAEIGRGISVTMGKLEKLAQRTALWRQMWRSCMLTLHSGQEENALR
jgi:hypothetical protein